MNNFVTGFTPNPAIRTKASQIQYSLQELYVVIHLGIVMPSARQSLMYFTYNWATRIVSRICNPVTTLHYSDNTVRSPVER